MAPDPHTPVIVGVGQGNRPGPDEPEPLDLLVEAADGRRVSGHSTDPDVLDFLTSDEPCGMAVDLLVDGTVRFGARARVAS